MSANAHDSATKFRIGATCQELTRAALAAIHAPSVLNTQPWRWRITHDTALLYADQTRRLTVMDPTGRLLVISCGGALHHACVTLAADGVDFEVEPFPGAGDPDLLAVVRYRGVADPSAWAQRLYHAIRARRTDRRPFAGQPVPQEFVDRLCQAAQRTRAHLHMTWARDITDLALAAGQASEALMSDPAYRAELAAWVRRPGEGHDGVPLDTLAPLGTRPVPMRDFTATGLGWGATSRIDLSDREARYGVVVTDGDSPPDWLAAGVTLSAVLLAATSQHLATSPMSDLVEHEVARRTLRRMLGGVGYPAVGVRIGWPGPGEPPPPSPRRPAAEVIQVVADEIKDTEPDTPGKSA
ncbi:Acg family FMN-binding oxidoreductase [Dactylosporangium sp. CA-139066]|uniref:Acg family FMN-binding oxidoreductase n=1 Tax=Dactylosporangium sp. CA-139066 TaxID=3239930 RepID=UPI003D93D642